MRKWMIFHLGWLLTRAVGIRVSRKQFKRNLKAMTPEKQEAALRAVQGELRNRRRGLDGAPADRTRE
jgi:hypothetical protein